MDRGQVFALEGLLAALVVLAGLVFALQATALTPDTTGASQTPVDQDRAEGLLAGTAREGSLTEAVVRSWDGLTFAGHAPFDDAIDDAFGDAVAVNVVVSYWKSSGSIEQKEYRYEGAPGSGAVSASTVLTVYDRGVTDGTTYLPDVNDPAAPGDDPTDPGDGPPHTVHNVIEVEVIAWQR